MKNTKIINTELAEFEQIVPDIFYVRLIFEEDVSFKSGQYLNILLENSEKRSFSIASTPLDKNSVELHIGAEKNNLYAFSTIEFLQKNKKFQIEIPLGNAFYREKSDKKILLIAGGTGYSYARSILTLALAFDQKKEIQLFWGVRFAAHLYDLNFLNLLLKKYPNVKIETIVEFPDKNWQGNSGLLLDFVLKKNLNLADFNVYLAGKFDMIKIAKQRFLNETNVKENQLFSDAFDFLDK